MMNSAFSNEGYSSKDKDLKDEIDRVHRFIATRALKTDKRNLQVDTLGYVNSNAVQFVVEKELTVGDIDHRKMGFRFGAMRNVEFKRLGLDSCYGFPYLANIVDASGNNISSINELPKCKYKSLDLSKNPITSLENIHTKLTECHQLTLPTTITRNVLGLLKVKGLNAVALFSISGPVSDSAFELFEALKIVNHYLRLGNGKSPDVFACQEDLIDADLKDFAEL